MNIYIMRHGEAVDQFCRTESEDAKRPLTENGQLEAFKIGRWLAKTLPMLDEIYVSPYLRTQQTCKQVLKAIEKSDAFIHKVFEPITLDFITPQGTAKEVREFIDEILLNNKNKDESELTLLIISHMPLVSHLISELTASSERFFFSTGTIAHTNYDREALQGEFIRIVSPSEL